LHAVDSGDPTGEGRQPGDHDDDALFDTPSGPLLHPDDRIWRHPSELADVGEASAMAAPFAERTYPQPSPVRPPRRRRPTERWLPVALSGAVGAMLTAGVLAASGRLQRVDVVETPSITQTSTVAVRAPTPRSPAELAERIRPSLMGVAASGGGRVVRGTAFSLEGAHVLTARRIVDGADQIRVMVAGEERSATLVGSDPVTDLAVLSVNGGGLQAAPVGSAASLRPGDSAIAVATPPGGSGPTVTAGVVSAVGRTMTSSSGSEVRGVLQFDRPVAPEAAGGVLLDGSGSVIGVTLPSTAELPGFGWAVPIEQAYEVARQIVSNGRAVHAWLGVEGADNGLTGALVQKVMSGSPAARAGLAAGDVVIAVDTVPVPGIDSLLATIRTKRPGDSVTLTVLRTGKPRDMVVTLTSNAAS
jgi:putative serine protease PepD